MKKILKVLFWFIISVGPGCMGFLTRTLFDGAFIPTAIFIAFSGLCVLTICGFSERINQDFNS